MQNAGLSSVADYDVIGRYRQDRINGFSDEFLADFLRMAAVEPGHRILEAMSGDGSLAALLLKSHSRSSLESPQLVLLECSQIQCGRARSKLPSRNVRVIWGDVVTMSRLRTGKPLPAESFDRVIIKSGNHEIPLEDQERLYHSIFHVLKPGGAFINLGFLFDGVGERDEFRQVARIKDSLAGMKAAVKRRHFLTREEFYGRLETAGFYEIRCARHFEYAIRSAIVAEQYFRSRDQSQADLLCQAAQVYAKALRRSGRIVFEGDSSVMRVPGEITIARKPPSSLLHGSWNRVVKKFQSPRATEEKE